MLLGRNCDENSLKISRSLVASQSALFFTDVSRLEWGCVMLVNVGSKVWFSGWQLCFVMRSSFFRSTRLKYVLPGFHLLYFCSYMLENYYRREIPGSLNSSLVDPVTYPVVSQQILKWWSKQTDQLSLRLQILRTVKSKSSVANVNTVGICVKR
jgi:hypothetical protein